MDGLPAPMPSLGPGVVTLLAAAQDVRGTASRAATLSPEHWRAPSAEQYRYRVRELVAGAHRAADQIDLAVAAAQRHAAELEYVRQALLNGDQVPR